MKLTPVKQRQGIRMGTLKGKIFIFDDFDSPLPKELLEVFNGQSKLWKFCWTPTFCYGT